jgi:hypothetical protein
VAKILDDTGIMCCGWWLVNRTRVTNRIASLSHQNKLIKTASSDTHKFTIIALTLTKTWEITRMYQKKGTLSDYSLADPDGF